MIDDDSEIQRRRKAGFDLRSVRSSQSNSCQQSLGRFPRADEKQGTSESVEEPCSLVGVAPLPKAPEMSFERVVRSSLNVVKQC